MTRDLYIDFLRFLGLSLVILVHINPPIDIAQVRCFDVPLMLFVSGLTVSGSISNNYKDYIIKRCKRLVLPVWMFLAVYLPVLYFLQFKFLSEQYLTGEMIIRSFLLLDKSIGYVWIIRIFLMVMLVTPFIQRVNNIVRSQNIFVLILSIMFVFLEGIHMIGNFFCENYFAYFIIVDIIQYGLAYSIPFFLGMRCSTMNKSGQYRLLAFVIVSFAISLVCYLSYYGLPIIITPNFKTPPHSYYIVYGCFVSVILWQLKNVVPKWITNRYFVLLGQNTIWIYLWHMPFALISTKLSESWPIRYIVVYSCAILFFMIQRYVVNKTNSSFVRKYFLG